MVQEISQKEIPDEVMLGLVKDISRNRNVPWNVEHDDFRKAGALVAWIQEHGYAVEMWGNYFLMVDYGWDMSLWKDSHKWADRFLSAEGPLENRSKYFIFVDNTK